MTDEMVAPGSALDRQIQGIKHLLWGPDIKLDIFKRWSQGFFYSKSERSALEQAEGGPCSIIAPVQAFILKNLLSEYEGLSFRDIMTDDIQNHTLIQALCQILHQCHRDDDRYYLVYRHEDSSTDTCPPPPPSVDKCDKLSSPPSATATAITADDVEMMKPCESGESVNGDSIVAAMTAPTLPVVGMDTSMAVTVEGGGEDELSQFHGNLRVCLVQGGGELERQVTEQIGRFKGRYGILLFLYSVIVTKGLETVQSESDTNEPLIDKTYGYGSQSLINLMITGRAVTYVWDFDQDVDGLKLLGLDKQSQIGFVTLMEHLQYITVGCFYKNPIHPVWVLGSETHLTVLFSDDKKIVSPETKSEQARRVFKSFDRDGNNFIKAECLQEVLAKLDLVSDTEYVDIMRKKLDSENFGIVLLNAFMDEFFPTEETSTPDMFRLVHYNGLAQSNINTQIKYHIGSAILLESDLKSICESNPMLTCLQTKWPTIEVTWCDNVTPSLN